jgi:hypothetical protein
MIKSISNLQLNVKIENESIKQVCGIQNSWSDNWPAFILEN